MTSRLLINLSLLLLAWQKVCAQLAPADVFFNNGAQFYISNNITAAKQSVETGLKIYPDDVKLKKLEELLKQQQQSQNNQSQQNQNQQKQSQQQNQQSSQKNSQDQQKQSQADQKKDEQQKQEQPKSSDQKRDDEKQDKPDAGGQPATSGQMAPEEAKRLLDSQKDNEQFLTLKPEEKPENNNRPIKDW